MTVRPSDSTPSSPRGSGYSTGSHEDVASRSSHRPTKNFTLEDQLEQKDELILVLTEELERAVEQLDRIQRTGGVRHLRPESDRPRAATGILLDQVMDKPGALAPIPSEILEEQRALSADLRRAVQQMEDLQAGLTLGRLEIQISELRDFIADRLRHQPPMETRTVVFEERRPAREHAPEPEPEPVSDNILDSPEWQQLKSRMLPQKSAAIESPVDYGTEATENGPSAEPLPDPPPKCDVNTASAAELAHAVSARDEYAAALLRRLRDAEVFTPVSELSQLEPHAPEVVAHLRELEARLQEHLRTAEVELSVQRARLSREQSKLKQDQEHLERQMKKLGLSGTEDVPPSGAANQQERRWSRFLGRPKEG